MANPTTNFGWQMPTSTDLVTDLPADFEVFGQAVDTALVDLKGGTTGQILAKASNTNMDFTWVANDVGDITAVTAGTGISGGGSSGDVTITNSMATAIDAKGDLIAGTGADAFARLAVGANNRVVMADSTTATGLKYGGEWISYTPTLGNITIGNGTVDGRYRRVGDQVDLYVKLTFGSTTSFTNYINVSLPFVCATGGNQTFFPFAELNDAGVGRYASLAFIMGAGDAFEIYQQNSAGSNLVIDTNNPVNATTPFVWTTNDNFVARFSYQV